MKNRHVVLLHFELNDRIDFLIINYFLNCYACLNHYVVIMLYLIKFSDDLSPVSPNNNLNMNATVLIEKIPGYVVKSHESSSSEELSTKSVPKKAYKKKTKKVVASRDNKPEVEEIAVSKSRKRRVESEVEPNEVKQISPTIEKTKRNRRAVNDDVYVSPEESVEPIELKKNSKVNSNSNKEDPSNSLLTGGKTGPFKRPAVMRKKTQNYYSTPEQSDEEEELIPSPEKIVVEMPNIIKEKPKLKKGTKKVDVRH